MARQMRTHREVSKESLPAETQKFFCLYKEGFLTPHKN